MINTVIIKRLSIHEDVEILGHVFHGLKEISDAVELTGSLYAVGNPRLFSRRDPKLLIPDVHVAEVWESYPCFDAEDRMYENRTYQNYFFSDKPFSPSKIREIISRCTGMCNYQYVNDKMPICYTPALYYVGDGDKMLLAVAQ